MANMKALSVDEKQLMKRIEAIVLSMTLVSMTERERSSQALFRNAQVMKNMGTMQK